MSEDVHCTKTCDGCSLRPERKWMNQCSLILEVVAVMLILHGPAIYHQQVLTNSVHFREHNAMRSDLKSVFDGYEIQTPDICSATYTIGEEEMGCFLLLQTRSMNDVHFISAN